MEMDLLQGQMQLEKEKSYRKRETTSEEIEKSMKIKWSKYG